MPVDNTIALQAKAQVPDLTGTLNSLAQLDMAGAHSALYGKQAEYQGMRLNALRAYSDNLSRGLPIEKAIEPLSAVDPAMAEQALKNSQLGTTLSSNRGYAGGDISALRAAGPEAYKGGLANVQSERELGANQQFAKTGDPGSERIAGPTAFSTAATGTQTQVGTQKDQLNLWGQVGNAILAGRRPDGTLDPAARATAFAIAQKAGASDLMIAQYQKAPDQVLFQIGQQLAAAGQTAGGYAGTSGAEAGNKKAAEAPFEKFTQEPGQKVYVGPGLAGGMQLGAPPQGGGAAPVQQGRSVPALPIFSQLDQQNGFPAGFMRGLVSIENPKMDPNAFHPSSHAAGLGQIVPSTFREFARPGESVFDPVANLQVSARVAKNYQGVLTDALGRPPNAGELYLAYQQGPKGALALLANPNMPAAQALATAGISPQRAAGNIRGNGGDPNAPASDFIDKWTGRFTVPGGPSTTPFGGRALTLPPEAGGPAQPAPGIPGPNSTANLLLQAAANNQGPGLPQVAPAPVIPQAPAPAPLPAPVVPAPVQAPPAAPPVQPPVQAPAIAPISTGQQPIVNAGGGVTLPGMSLEDKAFAEKSGTTRAEVLNKQFEGAKEGYSQANAAQLSINQLQKDLANLPDTGFLSPGSGATERLGWAKAVNTLVTGAGMAPVFKPEEIASAEGAQKITGRLGFELSRSLGAREAAQIVQQAIGLNPGIANTPSGAKTVAASINAAMQRQKDFYQYISANGNTADADIRFNKLNPVGKYVQEAHALEAVPQKAIDLLQQHPNSPTLTGYFDSRFGSGMSRYFTGQ